MDTDGLTGVRLGLRFWVVGPVPILSLAEHREHMFEEYDAAPKVLKRADNV